MRVNITTKLTWYGSRLSSRGARPSSVMMTGAVASAAGGGVSDASVSGMVARGWREPWSSRRWSCRCRPPDRPTDKSYAAPVPAGWRAGCRPADRARGPPSPGPAGPRVRRWLRPAPVRWLRLGPGRNPQRSSGQSVVSDADGHAGPAKPGDHDSPATAGPNSGPGGTAGGGCGSVRRRVEDDRRAETGPGRGRFVLKTRRVDAP